MSLFLQHIEGLYFSGAYGEIREQLKDWEETGKPFPPCIHRELDYGEAGSYRQIRDERMFPIRFMWLFELHEQSAFKIPALGRSYYHPELLYERWERCCTDTAFRKEAEDAGVLFDMEHKAISLRKGWVLIGDTWRDDLLEIEDYYGTELLFPNNIGELTPAFLEYRKRQNG